MAPHLAAAANLARWLIKDPREAEDVLQEAYVRALTFFDRFNGQSPRGWLLTIVRNACYSSFQRGRDKAVEPLDEERQQGRLAVDSGTPEAALIRKADARRINEAVAALDVEQREVFVLREQEGLSYKELAEVLAVPIGTVMSRLHRARRELQRRLCEESGQ